MKLSPTHDAQFAIAVSFAVIVTVWICGDALYMGTWYYVVVPLVAFLLGSIFQPIPLFQCGAALGVAITFMTYFGINWQADKPDGLLGLGHLSSLPGAALGVCLAALILRRISKAPMIAAFIIGLFGILGGFFINQVVICNTLMWCGSLSRPIR